MQPSRPGGAVIPDPGDVTYLVLADRAVPYLLAKVRWPDVAQAITFNGSASTSPDGIPIG